MVSKKLKRLMGLIAIFFISASALVCGCKAASLSESFEEPEIKEEVTLPELPEEETKAPVVSLPESSSPQAPSGTVSTQAEVAAEYEFTPISDTECSVSCTNNDEATYAYIPQTAQIDGKEYTVTEIAKQAFLYVQDGGVIGGSRLQKVIIPRTVKKIGVGAFQFCMKLTEVQGLSYVEEIGGVAFCYCRSLKQAYLPSVLTIGDQAFTDCESLESVYLYKVTSIGLDAFWGCTKLSEIVIPQSVKTMGYWVFKTSNTQVKIAKGTNTDKWDKRWNEGNENQDVIYNYEVPAEYKFTPINDTECIVSCTNKEIVVFADIPEKAIISGKQYTVTVIDYGAFSSCDYLERVHIPDSITYIAEFAFELCESLTGIDLNKVERIDNWAFVQCSALSEIVIPEAVTEVGNYVFDKCDTQIRAVAEKKPDGWGPLWNEGNENQNVIWGWFEGKAVLEYTPISETECSVTCTNKDEVTYAEVPETAIIDGKEYTVTEIGADCFYLAVNLEKVDLPDTIITVEYGAFCACELLTEIYLPNAKYIREAAFWGCTGLKSISLPKAVCIEYCAFVSCIRLQSADIPSVEWLETYAFAECYSLKEIVFPQSLTTVWGSIFNENNTQVKVVKGTNTDNWDEDWNKGNANQDVDYNYLLPAKFEFEPISDTECRVYCINKEEAMQADIPATAIIDEKVYNVTDISNTFFDCKNLEKAILPYTVTKIGDRAFYGCEKLAEISTVSVTEIGEYAFAYCSSVDELIISGVTKIGAGAFRGCKNLTSAEIIGADKIGSFAFFDCSSLSKISINGVKEIGTGAFVQTALKDIVIPASVQTMGSLVFQSDDTQIKAVAEKAPEGWRTNWNDGNANQNVIWGWVDGKAVFGYTAIEGTENCEIYCINKENVTVAEIPSTAIIDGKVYTVTKIADYGFVDCVKLKDIFIPASITQMGENVFNGCTTYIYVYADEKPEGWADNWNGDDENITWGWKDEAGRFSYTVISDTECEVSLINKLTAVEAYIPAKVMIDGKEYAVTKVADGGFKGSALLKKVVVPYTLEKIGAYAFADCPELESFSLYNVQTIGNSAFANCKKLERLFIPKSVKFVGNNILSGTDTAVYVRASSADGWAENWNAGNGKEPEFNSKLILPVEILLKNEEI